MSSVFIDAYNQVKSEKNPLMDDYGVLRLDCMTLEDLITSHDIKINCLKERTKKSDFSQKGKKPSQ